eukprot:snap_masked-scaffold_30-processed-gene-2.48-mRNA-1 protein AED:1.00 eAED:1.00 QI:0/-1/0/0/-1/1/1/0/112
MRHLVSNRLDILNELSANKIKIDSNHIRFCEGYILGKVQQSQLYALSRNPFKATKPLQKQDVDRAESFNPILPQINKNALLITDSFSKFTWVALDAKKSEVPKKLAKIMKKI